MLPKLLAIVIATGSFAFYMAAFFVPEVHRKSDFVWSGVGLFYAGVLWFCAGQMGGAEVLGQTASVALLAWLGWQTLLLRRTTTPAPQQTPLRFGSARTAKQRLTASTRPAMEYEFVEDGVVETEAEPSQAITVDRTGTLVVPAAVVLNETSDRESNRGPDRRADGGPDRVPDGGAAQGLGQEQGEQPDPEVVPPPPQEPPAPDAGIATPSPSPEVAVSPPSVSAAPVSEPQSRNLLSGIRSILGRKQKPSQPMVELPPRPPSIPKAGSTAKKGGQPMVELPPRPPSIPGLGKKKKGSQPMVELPPRPRSIPRPGKDESTPPEADAEATEVDESSTKDAGLSDADAIAATDAKEAATPADVTSSAAPAVMQNADEDFDDEDSNWPDDEDWV